MSLEIEVHIKNNVVKFTEVKNFDIFQVKIKERYLYYLKINNSQVIDLMQKEYLDINNTCLLYNSFVNVLRAKLDLYMD